MIYEFYTAVTFVSWNNFNMNIKITYNWLLEYLDTTASPYDIQKFISLCGPSVERVEKIGDDYVFDIEITSNRVDSASVLGFAQECTAILPQFGKKATLKLNPLAQYTFNTLHKVDASSEIPLIIELSDDSLATRITGIVISDVLIGESPEFIKKRLEMCGIRSINNVVDISNYLMLSLGQPTHTFDYDKIAGHKLMIRESKKGEKIKTLDELDITLPGGDIVIEDGAGKLTDLAGIMGGYDSMITDKTKNVLLFLETYNKQKLRRTSMQTGQRTVAATYFEKGLDEERIEPTLVYGVELLKKYAHGIVASPVYDTYKKKKQPKVISVEMSHIENLAGVSFTTEKATLILENLGFNVIEKKPNELEITIPTYRIDDIDTPEDISEEVTRIYGYHNLPSIVQKTDVVIQPADALQMNKIKIKVKQYLKHAGLHESYNYSMVSKKLLEQFDLNPENHLKLANTISTEIEYMRTSLIPSLIKNSADNKGKREQLAFFEIANTYHKVNGDLPHEKMMLSIVCAQDYFALKGIVEGLCDEINIARELIVFKPTNKNNFFDPNIQATLYIDNVECGVIGLLTKKYQYALELDSEISVFDLDFKKLVDVSSPIAHYVPINPYAVVKLDLTIKIDGEKTYAERVDRLKKISPLLINIELLTQYKDTLTLRFYFSDLKRNITESEAKDELKKIEANLRTV